MPKKQEKKVVLISEKKQQQMLAEELVRRTHCMHISLNRVCSKRHI